MTARRYWFHVSMDARLPDRVRFAPRTPCVGGPSEPATPRICVAPTVAGCLSAVVYCRTIPAFVYRTARRVTAEPAEHVADAHITGEHWILRACTFLRMLVIPVEVMRQLPMAFPCAESNHSGLQKQGKRMRKIKAILDTCKLHEEIQRWETR